jgi:hypothetical protein
MSAACSETTDNTASQNVEVAVGSAANVEWVRLDGEVVASTPGSPSNFILDYGTSNIAVEANAWDSMADQLNLDIGDMVSVTGRLNEGRFDTQTIRADAIYIEKLNAVFYANGAAERDLGLGASPQGLVKKGVSYTGRVADISTDGFSLGRSKLLVNTTQMGSGYQNNKVQRGERVSIWGDWKIGQNGDHALLAKGLVRLVDAPTTNGKALSTDNNLVEGTATERR